MSDGAYRHALRALFLLPPLTIVRPRSLRLSSSSSLIALAQRTLTEWRLNRCRWQLNVLPHTVVRNLNTHALIISVNWEKSYASYVIWRLDWVGHSLKNSLVRTCFYFKQVIDWVNRYNSWCTKKFTSHRFLSQTLEPLFKARTSSTDFVLYIKKFLCRKIEWRKFAGADEKKIHAIYLFVFIDHSLCLWTLIIHSWKRQIHGDCEQSVTTLFILDSIHAVLWLRFVSIIINLFRMRAIECSRGDLIAMSICQIALGETYSVCCWMIVVH